MSFRISTANKMFISIFTDQKMLKRLFFFLIFAFSLQMVWDGWQRYQLYQHPEIQQSRDLLLAAGSGNAKEVSRLLAMGADVNAKDKNDATPLHAAAWQGHRDIAELLIAKGADVNAKDKDGHTPLNNAIRKGHDNVAEVLRQHGGK
jgi:Ankyrin repeats (3 copies)